MVRVSIAKIPQCKLAAADTAFLRQEVDSLLELLDENLPLGSYEWKNVLQQHDMSFPGQK